MSEKKEKKEFLVSIDMKNSHSFHVMATSVTEAKEKGFEKLKTIRDKKSSYNIYTDRL